MRSNCLVHESDSLPPNVLAWHGGALIGRPILEEMRQRLARAACPEPPPHHMFFGLGAAHDEVLKKFAGPLEPLPPEKASLRERLKGRRRLGRSKEAGRAERGD